MIEAVQVKRILDRLNSLDPDLVEKLLRLRVACSRKVVAEPGVSVFYPDLRDGGFVPSLFGPLELLNTIISRTGYALKLVYTGKQNVRFEIVDVDRDIERDTGR